MPPGYSTTPNAAISSLVLMAAYTWDGESIVRLMAAVKTWYGRAQVVVWSTIPVSGGQEEVSWFCNAWHTIQQSSIGVDYVR